MQVAPPTSCQSHSGHKQQWEGTCRTELHFLCVAVAVLNGSEWEGRLNSALWHLQYLLFCPHHQPHCWFPWGRHERTCHWFVPTQCFHTCTVFFFLSLSMQLDCFKADSWTFMGKMIWSECSRFIPMQSAKFQKPFHVVHTGQWLALYWPRITRS